ncbi:FadR/GntR family transcriptional regulator [Xanthobacter oligotrophicus]|uniref:FadR/GntR family transcriptional regulator n=1 Tax=Xanthobacter oligotrophicus TaxID=2607286 RepID=UPI0011F18A67|nr:FadR/GntR family transcriptional regulator [Xanthobacter oligotrophicus]MCG5235323.1 FadR family transcriptional regulator [Xanthobacter oligotrophicus]
MAVKTKRSDETVTVMAETAPAARTAVRLTLGDRIYDEILHLIINLQIPEGGRLPTEAQLCKLYSVSRTVVREALSRLKIDGIVASRQGQGSVVLRRPNAGVFAFPFVSSIADMQRFFEFRQLIEGEVAALAASRRTHEELVRIRAAFDAVSRALSQNEPGIEEDLAFHFAIADAAHNKFLSSPLLSARDNFVQCIQFARALSTKPNEKIGQRLEVEHRLILEAIEAADEDGARAAMIAHLTNTRDRVFLGG